MPIWVYSYIKHLDNIIGRNWSSVHEDELNEYIISDHCRGYPNKLPPSNIYVYPLDTNYPELAAFKCGIKRDLAQPALFKQEKIGTAVTVIPL